jgi:hypothetical protein
VSLRDLVWPYVISLLAAITAVLVLLDVSIAPRAPLVLAFAAICPGMALVRLLRLVEPVPELLLAIVVSLGVSALVATVTIYAGIWNPAVSFLVIVGLTLVAVLADLLRARRPVI